MSATDDALRDEQHRAMIERARHQVEEARLRGDSWHSSQAHAGNRKASPASHSLELTGYRLDRELHRGGQGVVFRAVQESTGRTVAIKVLAHGALATRSEQLRFEREVQILGQLKAPGIVRIVDSGVAAGHWWFSMDYVDGIPLDEYVRFQLTEPAEGPHLSTAGRRRLIALFAAVVEAVSAAHLNGVIHRDLKPRNILIDREGQPHLVDFGLARRDDPFGATSTASSVATLTETGQFVGSLPWASPEQATGTSAPIDLRTDVYSLGVILFQLLTDRFPYQVFGAAHEVARNIATVAPTDPSTLARGVDDDLRTIVLKCLSKEAVRRYQSAGELARDLRHYLNGEAIEAKRDSFLYLVRSRLRRHRVAAIVAAAFALTIVGASITFVVLWRNAASARDRALDAEGAKDALLRIAELEMQESAEANRFLQTVIEAADPGGSEGRELTVRETMEAAIRQLDSGQLALQPEIEGAVRTSISNVLQAIGRFDEALTQTELALAARERALGRDHRDVAESYVQMSDVLSHLGRRPEAFDAAQHGLDIIRRFYRGEDHDEVVGALRRVAWADVSLGRLDEAIERITEASAMLERIAGADDTRLILMRLDKAVMVHGSLSAETARSLVDELRVRLGPNHPEVQTALKVLGATLQMRGDLDGAERCFREALESVRMVYGERHPLYIDGIGMLARVAARRGDMSGAIELMEGALPNAEAALGSRGFAFAQFLNDLGGMEWQARNDAKSVQYHSKALEIFRAIDRDHGADSARARVAIARSRLDAADLNEAERLASEVQSMDESELPPTHWTRAQAKSLVGQVRRRQGDLEQAEPLLLEASRALEVQPPWAQPFRDDVARELAELYDASGRKSEADAWRQRITGRDGRVPQTP